MKRKTYFVRLKKVPYTYHPNPDKTLEMIEKLKALVPRGSKLVIRRVSYVGSFYGYYKTETKEEFDKRIARVQAIKDRKARLKAKERERLKAQRKAERIEARKRAIQARQRQATIDYETYISLKQRFEGGNS